MPSKLTNALRRMPKIPMQPGRHWPRGRTRRRIVFCLPWASSWMIRRKALAAFQRGLDRRPHGFRSTFAGQRYDKWASARERRA